MLTMAMKVKFAIAISILPFLVGTAQAVGAGDVPGHKIDPEEYKAMTADEKRCADLQGFY